MEKGSLDRKISKTDVDGTRLPPAVTCPAGAERKRDAAGRAGHRMLFPPPCLEAEGLKSSSNHPPDVKEDLDNSLKMRG
jgi:hypothetical protein